MQEHVKMMTAQLKQSFDLISDKMAHMESRIMRADQELQTQSFQQQELILKRNKQEQDNMKLFQQLQKSV